MRLPYLKFYTRDWQSDSGLRLCSLAARGLWIELLCLMHQSSKRGYLQHLGTPLDANKISQLIGRDNGTLNTPDNRNVNHLLDELEAAGVFSRDETGCIYSRRMVEDEQRAEFWKETGKKGGNPLLKKKNKRRIRENPEPNKVNPPCFVIPSADEVTIYARTLGFNLDGNHFVDYYAARGWLISGKTKMRDWQAAVRTWKKNDATRNGQKPTPTKPIYDADENLRKALQ